MTSDERCAERQTAANFRHATQVARDTLEQQGFLVLSSEEIKQISPQWYELGGFDYFRLSDLPSSLAKRIKQANPGIDA